MLQPRAPSGSYHHRRRSESIDLIRPGDGCLVYCFVPGFPGIWAFPAGTHAPMMGSGLRALALHGVKKGSFSYDALDSHRAGVLWGIIPP